MINVIAIRNLGLLDRKQSNIKINKDRAIKLRPAELILLCNGNVIKGEKIKIDELIHPNRLCSTVNARSIGAEKIIKNEKFPSLLWRFATM